MKKLISLVLIIALCLTAIPVYNADAAIRLSKTNLTLDEGASYMLYLYGATKTIKWASSNQSIAKVSTKGKVTAVKSGSATITAKVSSKKYTCKITVKNILTDEEAAQNITYEEHKTDHGLVVIFNNDNKVNLYMKANVTYYDASGGMLSTEDNSVGTFQAGKKAVLTFSLPHDSNYNTVDYNRTDVKINTEVDSSITNKSHVDDISIESNKGSDGLLAKLTNNSDDEISSMDLTVLYYLNGEIIGFDEEYVFSLVAGDNKTVEFDNPYDENYDDIIYDDYEVVINEAYSY